MYIVKQPHYKGYLAILGVANDDEYASSTLFVNFVDMTTDSRGEIERPRLRQILPAFWTHTLKRKLQHLRRILFQNVTEHFTRSIIRERIATLLNVAYSQFLERPSEQIILTTPKASLISEATKAWKLICIHSKLVRSTVGLLRDFSVADTDEELAAAEIVINPALDQAGNAHSFDLQVVFGRRVCQEMTDSASQSETETIYTNDGEPF